MSRVVPDQNQLELKPVFVAQLDATRGVLDWYSPEDADITNSGERLRLSEFALKLGSLALPDSESSQRQFLDVGQTDVERATDTAWIERSLYIWWNDPRYNNGEQIVKTEFRAGVEYARAQGICVPFDLKYNEKRREYDQPGVVFPMDEYNLIARNPGGLINHIKNHTRRAHADTPVDHPDYIDRNEVNRRVKSSGAKVARSYVEKVKGLDDKYVTDRELLLRLRRQTKQWDLKSGMPVDLYKVKDLDKARKRAEEMFSQTAETVAINAGLTDKEVSAMHRARAKELFGKKGSTKDTDAAWQRQLLIQGRYINARRFKLLQSIFACQAYHDIYRPFMREIFFAATDNEQRVA
ncbi:MAG: hypothetical protein JWL89_152 [Candidatus Saccharibacteria bacterium]|nr:hypothetical protein [Candidatus Saccharibacteria bacterium]